MPSSPNPSQTREVSVATIGNSRGVRLPKELLLRYGIADRLTMELRPDGILLRQPLDPQASWEETYREMAAEQEDWSDLDAVAGDGLEQLTW